MNSLRRTLRDSFRPAADSEGLSRLVTFRGATIACANANKLENKLLLDAPGYDLANFTAVASIVRPGSTCLDIGANIGIYSAVMSRLAGETGQVHAFEPVRHIRRKLRTNLALNGARNVTVNSFALGDAPGSLEMFQVREGQFRGGTSTFMRNNNVVDMGEEAFEKQSVEIRMLDDYPLDRVDFVKIDVEGFELNVLRGARKTLERDRPAILFEHDQPRLKGLGLAEADFADFFRALDYSCFEIGVDGGATTLRPFAFDGKLRTNNLLALSIGDRDHG